MKQIFFRTLAISTLCLALAIVTWFLFVSNKVDVVAEAENQTTTDIEPQALGSELTSAEPLRQETDELSEEVLATRRMYSAHAPLREPEIDDPDSQENIAIMQQLISAAADR